MPADPRSCDGSSGCEAETHVHGCYSDDGTNCDHPSEHDRPVPADHEQAIHDLLSRRHAAHRFFVADVEGIDALVAALETARRQANEYEADLAQALVDADAAETERDSERQQRRGAEAVCEGALARAAAAERENERLTQALWQMREIALAALCTAAANTEEKE